MEFSEKYKVPEHIFCLLVGGIYLYSILRSVINATFIDMGGLELFAVGIFSLLLMMVFLFNYATRLISVLIFVTGGFIVLITWDPYRYEHLYEMFLIIGGQLPYRPQFGPTIVLILAMLVSFAIVVFMVHWFNFYVLAAGGTAAFLLTWLPGFSRDEFAFLLFFAAFCMILIRKANVSVSSVFSAVPLCIAVIIFTNAVLPRESELFEPRQIFESTQINDFFYEIFNPSHFAFQQTGFSGPGGRLGGPITPNNRYVMTVIAPGRTYLAGAISNEYVGDRWLRNLAAGDIYTHGLPPAQFEMLETSAALIRGATHADYRDAIQMIHLGLPHTEVRRVNPTDFPVLGVAEFSNFNRFAGNAGVTFLPGEPEIIISHILAADFDRIINHAQPSSLIMFYLHTYMPVASAEIRQSPNNRTGTVFRPPRAFYLRFNENSPDYSDAIQILPTGDMQTPGFMSRGAAYQMQFLNVNTDLSFVEHILREAGDGVYENRSAAEFPAFHGRGGVHGSIMRSVEYSTHMQNARNSALARTMPETPLSAAEFAELLQIYTPRDARITPRYIANSEHFMQLVDSFSREILAQYAREVRQNFLDVPGITSPRVHDLTHEIIRYAQNDFERVTAIRDYLLQFPYTFDPDPVPRGVCFVDQFLFEGQEGYCTYFATAMAVMSRIAGVPSRYVEGFVLPPSANPQEPVRVTNRMAHAWAEVYLEGFGWHIMEATPTYAFLMNPDAPPETAPGGGFTNPYWVERMQDLMPDFNDFATPPPFESPGFVPVPPAPFEPEEEPTLTPRHLAALIFAGAVLAALIFFAAYNIKARITVRRVKKLPPGRQVEIYFRATMRISEQFVPPALPDETENAYGLRAGKRFAYRSDTVFFRDLIALYYKAKYSPREITPDEAALMREAHSEMLFLLRETRLKWVYLYLYHVRGVGKIYLRTNFKEKGKIEK
ncbi:MAG: hypothetical protein FWC70_01195 [Defluviitaleaceae bacterium]|nr:hypothetical protein [Defluviitaleaceae bacterium]